MRLFSVFTILFFISNFTLFGAEVQRNYRYEGASIVLGSTLNVEDEDFALLSTAGFVDKKMFGYVRLGINDRINISLGVPSRIGVEVLITRYDQNGNFDGSTTEVLEVDYDLENGSYYLDLSDYREDARYKFDVTIQEFSVTIGGVTTNPSVLPDYIYLETGYYAERFYELDYWTPPGIGVQYIEYNSDGDIDNVSISSATASTTQELFFNWDYVYGAEYYDLEWTWVDNYPNSSGTVLSAGAITFGLQDFKNNCTRIRTSDQSYSIAQIFAKGYLIYRVRGVGRWLDDTNKDKYGEWSSWSTNIIENISDWPHYIKITAEHEELKNWQYQATYAEEGKKKEVVQYFDGSLRGRQTVTRINSNKQSVVGETVYDNEGRGVIQILPTPQNEPVLRYYEGVNLNQVEDATYSHEDFDWETSSPACSVEVSGNLSNTSGAGLYYSAAGHSTDENWQQYVPESDGYAFTQVEYTPDNTGRIRRQSGVGDAHKIGSERETEYYYSQPSQEELNRLFGYKVGHMSRYKKNMVVDANGQVSISYLDAQGRVVATAMAGDNQTTFDGLESETTTTYHNTMKRDILNKLASIPQDTPADNNDLFSTGRFGSHEDALVVNTQLAVVQNDTDYDFTYSISTDSYEEPLCGEFDYPFVYDLNISLLSDCGVEQFASIPVPSPENNYSGIPSITYPFTVPLAIDVDDLAKGTYTLSKELKINEPALNNYLIDYLSVANTCLLTLEDFTAELTGCEVMTCQECEDGLGAESEFVSNLISEDPSITSTDAENIYNQLLEDCREPCRPALFCDVYKGMLLADVSPGGQYAGLGSDPISPFATGAWRTNFNGTSENYIDQYGNIALVEAYPPSVGNIEYVLQNNGGTPELVEPWQLTRDDFMAAFEPSWAEGLLEFHPEYKLYLYAEDLCTVPFNVPNTQSGVEVLSSEEFDAILRNEIRTYAEAGGTNNFDIDFLSGNTIYDKDPYFNIDYSKHEINGLFYHDLKEDVMLEAISNYLHNDPTNGYSMLQYAVLTNVFGNSTSPPSVSSIPNTWGTVSSAYPSQIDAIWQTYLSYYLSYKGMINQYLIDMYGFSKGLYNGCIGDGNYAPGVLFAFNANGAAATAPNPTPTPFGFFTMYNRMVSFLMSTTINSPSTNWFAIAVGFNGTDPTLCAEYFNDKQLRINRMEAGTNPSVPVGQTLQELSEDADYSIWEQTGLCPLALDLERLLNGMGKRGDLLVGGPTLQMQDVPEFVPDLYQAFTTNSLPMTAGADVNISITVSSGVLNLQIVDAVTPFTSCTIEIPQLGSLAWSNYNTGVTPWYIFSVGSSFPVSSTEMKVVIRAGSTSTDFEEYVVTYTTSCSLDLDACQDVYSMDNSFDPDCKKEEQFEAALLCLMQTLVNEGEFDNTNVDLDASVYDQCYTNSILFDYFGAAATWDNYGVGGVKISSIGGVTSLEFTMPGLVGEDVVMFNSINLFSPSGYNGSLYYNAVIDPNAANYLSNIITDIVTYSYQFEGFKVSPINFSCTCEEMLSEQDIEIALGQIENAFSNMLNYLIDNGESYSPGMTSDEIVDFISYLECEDCDGIYDLTVGESTLSFELRENGALPGKGCTIEIDFTTLDFDEIYSVEIAQDHSFIISTHTYPKGETPESFDEMTGVLSCFNLDWFCEQKCQAYALAPLSCTDEYAQYYNEMDNFVHMNPTDEAEYLANYVVDELDFCNSSFAYISDAYIAYLSGFPTPVTNISDVHYLSISSFGNTPIGYNHDLLVAAVSAYLTATTYSDPTLTTYLSWHDYISDIYLPSYESEYGNYCPPKVPAIYTNDTVPAPDPCEWESNVIAQNATTQYQIYLDQVAQTFVQSYIEQAMSSVIETFDESHLDKEYHYTLYYYDRAGNLIQTVPPKGVDRFQYDNGIPITAALNNGLTAALNSDINSYRTDEPEATALLDGGISGQLAPDHKFETLYRYNSLNQLVYQKTPDGGESRFAYDALGRLILSQNAKQILERQYSYTKYDNLGRVKEVGELTFTNPGAGFYYQIREDGVFCHLVVPPGGGLAEHVPYPGVNSSTFPNNLSNVREEVTRTIYDELVGVSVDIYNGTTYNTVPAVSVMGNLYQGDNTRNRIVAVLYENEYDSLGINNYDNATFYDYDVHGNVKQLIQVNNNEVLKEINHHIKHFDYEYDLVSGNVLKVIYQKGYNDQYIHRYHYDADNRITIAETSKDDMIFEKDAKYFYYDHGPLARTELGEKKVQALDYAYTIQGWLKGVNGEQVSEQTMMGFDGKTTTVNSQNGRDAFGFSLSYFADDYASAEESMLNHTNGLAVSGASIYNGNIRSMITALTDEDQSSLYSHQTQYEYDQLNRIKNMTGNNILVSSGPQPSKYSSSYSYDENGNLKTLERYTFDGVPSPKLMDDFTYTYHNGNNKLRNVSDAVSSTGSSGFGDIQHGQIQDNYKYDSIGQLIHDDQEDIDTIYWKVTNKVDKIVYDDGRVIKFDYDAMGNRIAKHIIIPGNPPALDNIESTFYILDAQGNPMSVYTYASADNILTLAERNIYGSSRLGLERLNQIMDLEDIQINNYCDFGFLTLDQSYTSLCNAAGTIAILEGNGMSPYLFDFDISDTNGDGLTDLLVNNNPTASNTTVPGFNTHSPVFSSHIMLNTIVGESYTISFDVIDFSPTVTNTGAYIYDCGVGLNASSIGFTSPGSKSFSFVAGSTLSRFKLFNECSNSAYAQTVISNLVVDGPGDIYGLGAPSSSPSNYFSSNEVGDKRYELSNHLGNVLEVITDRKLALDDGVYDPISGVQTSSTPDGYVDFYTADVIQYSDYYPFGMVMPGRKYSGSDKHSYGFQGQLLDDEVKGEDNSVNYKYRMHDPRVGRFFAVDPLATKYAWFSPYQFSGNSPILSVELEGMESAVELNYQEGSMIIRRNKKGNFEVIQAQLRNIGPGGYGHNWNTNTKTYSSNTDNIDGTEVTMDIWCGNCRSVATGENKGAWVTVNFPKVQVVRSYDIELERDVVVEGDVIKGSPEKFAWKDKSYDKMALGSGSFNNKLDVYSSTTLLTVIKGWAETYSGENYQNASLEIITFDDNNPELIKAVKNASLKTGVPISISNGAAIDPNGNIADMQGKINYQEKVKTQDATPDTKEPDTVKTEKYTKTKTETYNPVVIHP